MRDTDDWKPITDTPTKANEVKMHATNLQLHIQKFEESKQNAKVQLPPLKTERAEYGHRISILQSRKPNMNEEELQETEE